jgi:hypothetical protein
MIFIKLACTISKKITDRKTEAGDRKKVKSLETERRAGDKQEAHGPHRSPE